MKRLHKWLGVGLVGLLIPVVSISVVRLDRQARRHALNRALIAAIKTRHTRQAMLLLEQGADANARDTPEPAQTFTSLCRAFVQRLTGAQPTKDTSYYPPALLLIYPQDWRFHYETDRTLVDNAELVQALLRHGADPNAQTEWGDSLLCLATGLNHSNTVRVLLEHHVDPNIRSGDSLMPLMWTGKQGPESAGLLIQYGADVNARDVWGETPLMWTIGSKNCEVCQLLLDHGADINAQDKDGRTALMRTIEDYRSYVNPWSWYKLNWLVQHGARVHLRDKSGKDSLQYAHASLDPGSSRPLSALEQKALISLLEVAANKETAP